MDGEETNISQMHDFHVRDPLDHLKILTLLLKVLTTMETAKRSCKLFDLFITVINSLRKEGVLPTIECTT